MLYYLCRPYAAGAGKTARMGETVTMAWYDNAVFYHIYPLGLADALPYTAFTRKNLD